MDKLENSKNEIIEPRPELILSSSEIKNFEPMDLVSVSGEKLTNFKNESRSILESANLNIGLSAEKIDKIQNESGVKDELKAIDDEAEKFVQAKIANTKTVEEVEKEEEELPYSKDFIKNIQNLYFQEQSRLEDLGVSGQTLQVRLGEYKKRILEPMLEKESEENEALNKNEANITEENDSSIKQEDQVSKDNSEGNSQIDAVGDDNEEMSEKKSNKTEGIVKKVSYEEWTKTLNPKLLPNAKEYENLSPTYFVDDKNNHFVAFNEGGKKMVDKLYLNENNRVYVMSVDPLSIENK